MKNFIKNLHLRLSDLFLFVGFVPFALFLIFGQLFMQYPNPNDVAFKLWMIIPSFIILVASWSVYIYLEYKRGNIVKNYINWIFIVLAVIGLIGIFIQPSLFVENVVVRRVTEDSVLQIGDVVTVSLTISGIHYAFFAMDILAVLLFIYIGLFIFPKRFTSLDFIKYLGYAIFVLLAALLLYSLIFEHANIGPFIKILLGKGEEGSDISVYAFKSFIIHRNAYGMVLMIGIIFCFINHLLDKKWWYYLLMGLFYINMIFTYCKTSLLISALLIAIYVIYQLIITYKDFPKRNRNIFIAIGVILILAIGVIGISLLTKGKFLGFIYLFIKSYTGSTTLDMRSYIWDNCYQLLRANPAYLFFGRGFGLINLMLLPMNTVNGDAVFPTHSAYVNLLAEGGILYLLAYLLLLGYAVYVAIKTYKNAPKMTVAVSLGTLAFILYSTTETIHYLVYIFFFVLFTLNEVSKEKVTSEEATESL